MSQTWLIITILAALAATTATAMIILTVGRQSHERRPGHLDLTGIKPRAGYTWPAVSRVRAQAGGWDGFTSVRLVRDGVVVRSWWRPVRGEVVEVAPGEVIEVRDHADERWQAIGAADVLRSGGGEAA